MNETTGGAAAAGSAPATQHNRVRTIGIMDIVEAFGAGVNDFRAAPMFGLFFGAFYALGGAVIVLFVWYLGMPYLAYPLAMGFALIAPFVVTGLYDISRRLQRGERLSWSSILGSIWDARRRDLRWMALVTAFALFIWMDIAAMLFLTLVGFKPLDINLVNELLSTPSGLLFLAVGHTAGALIAFSVFSISVVSFPMLFDRDIDFVTAMVTSVNSVVANPVPLALWCIVIAALTIVSIMSAFVGLLVVLPVLGHASWHLYQRLVEPAHPG